MNNKSLFLWCLLTASNTILIAQTQQGYIRTLERPEMASVALGGVTVQMHGDHNAVVSSSDGLFRLPMIGKRPGESYMLQQVQKNGYELADQSVIGRQYAYSDYVPLTVVMVSSSQLRADKQRIENIAYQTAERNYHQQINILEQQLSDSVISLETYRTQLQEIQQNLERYQGLIESLADHYARTDYALLDEKEREVNLCIERGELERAESLLTSMFNPLGVLKRNQEALADANRRLAEGQDLMGKAQRDLAAVLQQQNKDAEYLYQLYTISLSRFDNDKARYYIETRSALDTTNLEWLDAVSFFYKEYLGDFDYAMKCQLKCIRQASIRENVDPRWLITPYYNLGQVCLFMGQYEISLNYLHNAQDNANKYSMKNSRENVNIYSSIGLVYTAKKDFITAISYYDTAFNIAKQALDTTEKLWGALYNNRALCYMYLSDYPSALKAFYKALEIWKYENNEISGLATLYVNIGTIYLQQGLYTKTIECCDSALNFFNNRYDPKHPYYSYIYNLLGLANANIGNYPLALDYSRKALNIQTLQFGDFHPNNAIAYNNIGYYYHNIGEYTEALNAYESALKILEYLNEDENDITAFIFNNMGEIYRIQQNIEKARDYFTKALKLWTMIYGEENDYVALATYNVAIVEQDKKKALEGFNKAYSIWAKILGIDNSKTIMAKEKIDELNNVR